jgi:lysine 6-dehydrogenase
MMGRAIAFDLGNFSNFDSIAIADKDRKTLQSAEEFLEGKEVDFLIIDINNRKKVENLFQKYDVVISAIPYKYNYYLAEISLDTKTHFLDLGGNNDIVDKERSLFEKAKQNNVTIIPDCGLAPGLSSVIVRDIVEELDFINFVKIRVGGLPINPQPPLNYQIVFSPYGLINEYVEDAIILKNGKIIKKKSMTDIETFTFPKPFGKIEAFLTSGGCSTLPYTYKNKINYLDYKTLRYPGHCEKFKTLLDLGFSEEKEIKIGKKSIVPRDLFANLLLKYLPINGKDVVLLKVLSQGKKDGKNINLEYTMIDHYDEKNNITSMMRTTGYPVSITAQMIQSNMIDKHGVFCSEEIVPSKPFFKELEKRKIKIIKKEV